MPTGNGMSWFIILTMGAYATGVLLHRKVSSVWSSPILISPLLIIPVLLLTGTDYLTYQTATQPLTFLLGPAQIAMVIPLYKHAHVLLRHIRPVIAGVSLGSCSGFLFVVWVAYLFHVSQPTIVSLAPKSVTTPMAISVSHLLGGLPELTAFFVLLTGLTAILIGPLVLRVFGVKSTWVQGLAMGTAASMVGVTRASQWGELEGVMGVLGMTLSAVIMAVLAPELLSLLL
jgi:putative effector of murein hydrolase